MPDRPWVAGVGGGVGTSTIAAALEAVDAGQYPLGQPVHVLVCRMTEGSLHRAQVALASAPFRPVLAVVADSPGAWLSRTMRSQLRMCEGYRAGVVTVPVVATWRDVRGLSDPRSTVTPLSQHRASTTRPRRPERGFVAAMQQLYQHVLIVLGDHNQQRVMAEVAAAAHRRPTAPTAAPPPSRPADPTGPRPPVPPAVSAQAAAIAASALQPPTAQPRPSRGTPGAPPRAVPPVYRAPAVPYRRSFGR
jgi:hypothetical protein